MDDAQRLAEIRERVETEVPSSISWADVLQDRQWLLAKVEDLQGELETLPKTADGVRITPGMLLWWVDRKGDYGIKDGLHVTKVTTFQVMVPALDSRYENPVFPCACYSTQAAAKAAEEKP